MIYNRRIYIRSFALILMISILLATELRSTIIRVPTDQPTIQAGIDSAIPGDTVLVADGTYTGGGNRDIRVDIENLVIMSENGPEVSIIDCQGSIGDTHRAFLILSNVELQGFTMRNGWSEFGSAIICGRDITVKNCYFIENIADDPPLNFKPGVGGAIASVRTNLTILDCVFIRNSAVGEVFCGTGGCNDQPGKGAAVYCEGGTVNIDRSTFVGNSGGATVYLWPQSPSLGSITNSIFSFNSDGIISGTLDLACCDFYGNGGGIFPGNLPDQLGVNGNFSLDPLFCDTAAGDYHIEKFSPCAAEHNSCSVLIGALDVGCDFGFVCADANGDGQVTYDDLEFMITYYFAFGPVPNPLTVSDLNVDGAVDLGDIMFLAEFLNGTGPAPCASSEPPPFIDWKKEPEGRATGTQ